MGVFEFISGRKKPTPGEMAKQRPEYAQDAHLDALTSFKAEATRVIGTRPAS